MKYLLLFPFSFLVLVTCTNNFEDRQGMENKRRPAALSDLSSPAIEDSARVIANRIKAADGFELETGLLELLISNKAASGHRQLISHRLQTFDLRHLNQEEQLIILDLYEKACSVFADSPRFLQTSLAKLQASYPSEYSLVNNRLEKILAELENSLKDISLE